MHACGCRAESELQVLHHEVSRKVAQLQVTVGQQEIKYKVGGAVQGGRGRPAGDSRRHVVVCQQDQAAYPLGCIL